jgi:hypothetical protein
MNLKEKKILNQVLKIKEKLTKLKLDYLKQDPSEVDSLIKINPVDPNNIKELLNYPIEYKLFIEYIGEVYVVFATAFMLDVSLPAKLYDSFFWAADDDVINNEDLRIIAHTDNNDIFYWIYNVTKVPFERYFKNEECSKGNFLDIIESKIEECQYYD